METRVCNCIVCRNFHLGIRDHVLTILTQNRLFIGSMLKLQCQEDSLSIFLAACNISCSIFRTELMGGIGRMKWLCLPVFFLKRRYPGDQNMKTLLSIC
jgi:hypothetical protein